MFSASMKIILLKELVAVVIKIRNNVLLRTSAKFSRQLHVFFTSRPPDATMEVCLSEYIQEATQESLQEEISMTCILP